MEHHDFYPFLGWFYLLSAWYSLPPTIFFGFFCLLAYYPQDHLVLSLSNLRSYAGHLDLAYLGFFSLLAYYPQDHLVLSHSSTSREHDLAYLGFFSLIWYSLLSHLVFCPSTSREHDLVDLECSSAALGCKFPPNKGKRNLKEETIKKPFFLLFIFFLWKIKDDGLGRFTPMTILMNSHFRSWLKESFQRKGI